MKQEMSRFPLFHFPTAERPARRYAAQHHLSSSVRQDARGAIRRIDSWLSPHGESRLGSASPHRMGSSDSSLSYWSRSVLARKKMTPEATNRKPATEAMAMPTTSGSDTYSSQCSPRYHQFSPTRHLASVEEAQLWPQRQVETWNQITVRNESAFILSSQWPLFNLFQLLGKNNNNNCIVCHQVVSLGIHIIH